MEGRWRRAGLMTLLAVMASGASCRSANGGGAPQIVRPGAPGQPSRVISAEAASAPSHRIHTEADLRFVQGMIGHHAQAIEMTSLVDARTDTEAIRKLAARIEASQADEIRMMQEWLTARGASLPDPHAHHTGGVLMPGMLTAGEMARLSAARGPEFDRLFLEYMIKHHEGALVMVRALFSEPGGGQEASINAFASDVDTDQRTEIARMREILKEMTR